MKSEIINFQLTKEEKELIKNISEKLGLSISGFVRQSILKTARQENFIFEQSKIGGQNAGAS